MKLFFLLAPGFLELPLAVARELMSRLSGTSLSVLSMIPRGHLRVETEQNLMLSHVDYLNELEWQWLASPADDQRLADYEARLGPGSVKRTLIADRLLGIGLIYGGIVPPAHLSDLAADSEAIRRYLLGALDYAFNTLEKARPDLVFFDTVDNAAKLAFAQICEYLHVPFSQLSHSRLGSRYVVDDSPLNLLGPVQRLFQRALDNPACLEQYIPQARTYLANFRADFKPPDYFNFTLAAMQGYRKLYDVISKFTNPGKVARLFAWKPASVRNHKKWQYLKYRAMLGWRAKSIMRKGIFRAVGDLPTRPFVYFPLHYDPEMALQVLAPMHTDQIAVVEALAKSIPLGMDLVLKEHPLMLGLRPDGFYERLRRLPTVALASPEEPSIGLVRKAALTTVITGTAAWEAMLLGRQALIMGQAPFLAVGQGFVHCPDLSRLPEAIEQALRVPPADDDRLALYLAAMLARSFELEQPLFWGEENEKIVAQNRANVVKICDDLIALHKCFMERENASGRLERTAAYEARKSK